MAILKGFVNTIYNVRVQKAKKIKCTGTGAQKHHKAESLFNWICFAFKKDPFLRVNFFRCLHFRCYQLLTKNVFFYENNINIIKALIMALLLFYYLSRHFLSTRETRSTGFSNKVDFQLYLTIVVQSILQFLIITKLGYMYLKHQVCLKAL